MDQALPSLIEKLHRGESKSWIKLSIIFTKVSNYLITEANFDYPKKMNSKITNSTSMLSYEEYELLRLRYGCYIKFIDSGDVNVLQYLQKVSRQSITPSFYIGVICIMLSGIVAFVNLVFLYGFLKTNKRLTQIQMMFVYLTCTDLVAGFLAFPLISVGHFYGQTCDYQTFMMAIIGYVSAGDATTTTIISILRLHSILRPLN